MNTTGTLDAAGIARSYIALWNETDAARRRQLREPWTLGPSGAEDLIQGTDFVRLAANGKLQSVTGFLDKVPAGA